MRAERSNQDAPPSIADGPLSLAIVGQGRAGGALARRARDAGIELRFAGREDAAGACAGASAVLLCVPDGEIEAACEAVADGGHDFVGHVSGATGLDPLAAAVADGAEPFALHPLQTIPDPEADLIGTPAAVSGSTAGLAFATSLAGRLGLRPFELSEDARAAYHAAACIASNFLVTLEESAATLLERSGVENGRELLTPLVLRTAANWAERGGDALTGPIARGDERTVAAHLEALGERAPDLLPLYEALADRARTLAGEGVAR